MNRINPNFYTGAANFRDPGTEPSFDKVQIQLALDRKTVKRRAYEYDHHYGVKLSGLPKK
jgi:hypothetical protein